MKQLSNELHWPDLKKDTIDQLYLYSICTDDLLEVPAKEGGFLCYSVKSCFPDPGMCDLEDVFFASTMVNTMFLSRLSASNMTEVRREPNGFRKRTRSHSRRPLPWLLPPESSK